MNKISNVLKRITRYYNFYFSFVFRDFLEFRKKTESKNRFSVKLSNVRPMVAERTKNTEFSSHYIYHTAWAARILSKLRPKKHVDISSILYFGTIVSAFIPIEYYEYRPIQLNLENYKFGKADLLALPFSKDSIESLSCMHAVEHIGLGRYGDSIDPNGDLKAIAELKRVLRPNGNLLLVVPIGKPKISFNAHRIYSYQQILDYFADFKLKDFSLIKDSGEFIRNSNQEEANDQNYGCGCFWFQNTAS